MVGDFLEKSRMVVTTSISIFSITFKDCISPRTPGTDPKLITLSRRVNKAASDEDGDIVNGYSYPSTGANCLIGGGGNDKLISNVNTTAPCFLQGSSDTSSQNSEIDILTGNAGTQDHFILGNFYRGSGYAIINNFDPKEDFIYLKQGTGGQPIGRSGTPCGYTTALGKLAGNTGTFVYRTDGDVVAFINGYAVYPNSGLAVPFDFSPSGYTSNYSIFESSRFM